MIKFSIPVKVNGNLGLNKIYAGVHWSKRAKDAEYIHMLMAQSLRSLKIYKKLFEKPVAITISYNSRLDIDNHGYLAKLIIDGLKGYLIVDDNKKYVTALTQQFYNGDGIMIEIEEVV